MAASYEEISAELAEATDGRGLTADGFSAALVGLVEGWFHGGRGTVALYDYARCVEILVAEGMDRDEAEETMEINVCGAFVGEHTPAFALFYRPVIVSDLL